MERKSLLALAVFIVLLSVTLWIVFSNSASPSQGEVAPPAAIRMGTTTIVSSPTTMYDISLEFPRIASPLAAKANEHIVSEMMEVVHSFIKEEDESADESSSLPKDLPKSSLTLDSEVVYEDAHLISFLVTEEEYSRGAAHPAHFRYSYVYDKEKQKILSLPDIFDTSRQGAFSRLISVVAPHLEGQLASAYEVKELSQDDKGWIKEGLSDTKKAWKTFVLGRGMITFYFDEYLVAPYAAGPQSVSVPLSEFGDIVKYKD